MTDDRPITVRVNGVERRVHLPAETALIHVLRWELGLVGVRAGCSMGSCGSCTILRGGAPLRSCITPLAAVEGEDLVTPEGLGTPERPAEVQQAFLAEQAGQCGYCINGMIMSLAAAAASGDDHSPETAVSNHICRCGTHVRIRRAARRALAEGDVIDDPGARGPLGPQLPDVTGQAQGDLTPTTVSGAGGPDRLLENGVVEARLALRGDGRVEIRPGKVELGQGIHAALIQIAASQMGLRTEQFVVATPTTGISPEEGVTSGSSSIDEAGVDLARAARAFRRLLLARGAAELGVEPDEVRLEGPRVVCQDGSSVSFITLSSAERITGVVTHADEPNWGADGLGSPVPRDDLRSKLTGTGAFIHDLELPGMLHARAILPPTYDSVLREPVDTAPVSKLPGVVRVLADDRLLIVIAEREEQAIRGAARLGRSALWDERPLTGSSPPHSALDGSDVHIERRGEAGAGGPPDLRASYSQPYQAHAPIAPSCALAIEESDRLAVWTHSQGIYPLRSELAAMLEVEASSISVEHVAGPGCYGQTLADDAAGFAALAAGSVPGRPVRFQFSIEDEFSWEPYGPAMSADVEATLASDGRITTWMSRTLTDAHASRPRGSGTSLVPSWLRSGGHARPWRGVSRLGARNAVPGYRIPAVETVTQSYRGPLRTGALRSLGAFFNVFVIESFVDELAEIAGIDPLEFRSRHIGDPRARRVLEAAARGIGWRPRRGPTGEGLGLAVSRYKDSKAYVAQAVDLELDRETLRVRVRRIVLACDAGTVINADGIKNQLEGGTIQALSRTLHEEVRFNEAGITSRDWTTYPVLSIEETPRIDVILLGADEGRRPLGAGEAASPGLPAAMANALADATGVRFRRLPFTPDRVRDRLFELTPDEADRVI